MKRKIAILTIFQGNYNYGGMLQAYALSYIINRLGYNAWVLRQIWWYFFYCE